MEKENYFEILNVDPEASIAEIRRVYRKLSFKYHPDHNYNKKATAKFHKINMAYKVLSNPVKREEYKKGYSSSITDKPRTMLNSYWEIIIRKGFQEI